MDSRRKTKTTATAPSLLFLLLSLHTTPWISVSANSPASNDTAGPLPSPFLKDVAAAVADKEGWDPAAVRVSRLLEGGRAKVGRSKRYEFRMRAAGRTWVFRDVGVAPAWKAAKGGVGDGLPGADIFTGADGSRQALEAFELRGPLDLRAAGGGVLSVLLPNNASHNSVKNVIVGEGIRIKIKRALEVSIVIPSDLSYLVNGSLVANKKFNHWLLPREYPSCRYLLTVYIRGPASVSAHMIRDARAPVQTTFHSPDVLELLPERCFHNGYFRRASPINILSLGSKLDLIDKILRTYMGNKILKSEIPHFVKVTIISVTLVKFWMEAERDFSYGDSDQNKTAQWKTKPRVERVLFEIIARVGDNRQLKPVLVKKLKKPFIVAEITALSSLMSNISLSRLLSSVVPHEPLTLDVKW